MSKYFGFWLSKSFSKRSLTVYFVMETWFFCSYKVNWELLLCMYLNCWNRVVSYNFDVVNLFIRWFWHLVEWKFFKIESQCILHSVTINFYSYEVAWKYFHVCGMNCWNEVVFCYVLLNPNMKAFWLLFGWNFFKYSLTVYFRMEPWFCYSYKLTWELLSCVWM